MTPLLQIYSWVWWYKNVENRPAFHKVIGKGIVLFSGHGVQVKKTFFTFLFLWLFLYFKRFSLFYWTFSIISRNLKVATPHGREQLRLKVLVGYNGIPTLTSKTAPSLRGSLPQSNTPIPRPNLYSPPQTASRSSQPFCHSIPSGRTDRQTDLPTDRWATSTGLTLYILTSDADKTLV